MIEIKTKEEIEKMRVSGRLAAETLSFVGKKIAVGMTTEDLDRIVYDFTISHGARPAPLGYRGSDGSYPPFPKSCCISINDVVCHGIPGKQKINDGDIVNVDITSIVNGYHGDTSVTFVMGNATPTPRRVTEVARNALFFGIEQVKPGARIGDIGAAIQQYVESENFNIVKDFVGHGIGKIFHMDPQIFHFGTPGTGLRLRPGMTFTIEPMVNVGSSDVYTSEEDFWTVRTVDRSLSAQFEHTILVTETGYEILTLTT